MRRARAFATVVALAALVGCHDSPGSLTAPAAQGTPGGASSLSGLGLVYCSPLPADSASAVIGAAGGSIQVGPHTLTVPEGALDSDVTITAAIVPGSVNAVQFGPQGLQFDKAATLSLSYANCSVLGLFAPGHIAYTSDLLSILDLLPALADPGSQTVNGRIRHFSDYAVAW